LAFVKELSNIGDAYALEKQVQGWSRAKREALIRGDLNEVSRLGRKKFTRAPGIRS
jgi:putative endonuclease